MSEDRQLSSFFVHDLFFGIEVQRVQEAIRHLEMTRVPLSPPLISGLVNLRGQIITAIDLRRCLNLPERLPDRIPVNLILQTGDGLVSLLVDEIGDVLEPGEDTFEPPPAILQGRLRDLVCKTYKLPGRLLLVLDIERLLSDISSEVAPASNWIGQAGDYTILGGPHATGRS
jgi:purine-binding chemotaxis protein CheW